jgi:hypothetical protein
VIYFIRDHAAGRVKIGYSADPWKRFTGLQTGSSSRLVLEAVVAGEKDDEKALHARFKDRRDRGEWFVWVGPIALFVAGLEAQLIAVPTGSRDRTGAEITRAVVDLGFSPSYACELRKGRRPWPLDIAVGIWRLTGHQVGPLRTATHAELAVLEKYAPHFRPSKPTASSRAA